MYGAIIGDLAGSIYEYEQTKKIKPVYTTKIIENNAFYSDDTILTIAILDAILNNKKYSYYLKKYINKYSNYKPNFEPYFKNTFSPNLIKWCSENTQGNSCGNGAMMRISPIGYMFNTEQEVIENAFFATIPSHNSNEAVKSATIIALMIYYFRMGLSKDEVYKKLNINFEYRPFLKFNTTCEETLNNCLYAIYNSDNFEDSIIRTLSFGGDTDTNAAIVGSVTEAVYGIDDKLIKEVDKRLPNQFVYILKKARFK